MTDRDKTISPAGSLPGSRAGGPSCRPHDRGHDGPRLRAEDPDRIHPRGQGFHGPFGRSADQASAEDLRRYQLHMRSIGASATSTDTAVSALRFFFTLTLGRGDAHVAMTTVRGPRRLPLVLSPEEVRHLLDAAQSSSPAASSTGRRSSLNGGSQLHAVPQWVRREDRYVSAFHCFCTSSSTFVFF